MRKIAELGLKKGYETNHKFALALKMLPALAFEKEEEKGNSKSAEYLACLRRKSGFSFLSRYGALELNLCSFVL